jgi:GNAT superfamily N-acetyltransferase
MTEMTVVRPGTADAERAVEILADAFYDDPAWAWAFPDASKRRDQHARLWSILVDGATRYPYTFLDATRAAVAVWIPPGASELSEDNEAQLAQLVEDELAPNTGPILELFARFDAAHPREVPHYFLTLLGTDPDYRGRGLGLGLLGSTLEIIDRDGAPAYLEASNPGNVPLYERYGFRQIGSFDVPDSGLSVATMWRDARPLAVSRG